MRTSSLCVAPRYCRSIIFATLIELYVVKIAGARRVSPHGPGRPPDRRCGQIGVSPAKRRRWRSLGTGAEKRRLAPRPRPGATPCGLGAFSVRPVGVVGWAVRAGASPGRELPLRRFAPGVFLSGALGCVEADSPAERARGMGDARVGDPAHWRSVSTARVRLRLGGGLGDRPVCGWGPLFENPCANRKLTLKGLAPRTGLNRAAFVAAMGTSEQPTPLEPAAAASRSRRSMSSPSRP